MSRDFNECPACFKSGAYIIDEEWTWLDGELEKPEVRRVQGWTVYKCPWCGEEWEVPSEL